MGVYSAIWRKVKELNPNALQKIQSVMSDYERAAMTIAREVFPNSRLTGCWFHFNQAVLRRWKALGLTAAPNKVLKLTMALPLAPADMFEQGLQIIQDEADAVSVEYPVVLQFTAYLRRIWFPLKDKVSVFDNLRELITDQEINMARLLQGRRVKRVRVRYNMVRETHIAEAQFLLNLGRYSLKEFLLALSNATQLPEENIDLQDNFEMAEEMADGHLFDAYTVEQPAPVVHYEIQQADTIHPIRTIARDEPLALETTVTDDSALLANHDVGRRRGISSRGRGRPRRRDRNLQRGKEMIFF
ncbi:uncharacterized protein [Mycetomoellerius zeteki]|uniref:uncharacterized protein n=1 Tax=Mycetomoellerius zeteki TaxID=64791 RepID=UPI00084EBA07|nr:PREDICTED: uncharacterized protein LOC108720638 [Trachymyrmex zeteki]